MSKLNVTDREALEMCENFVNEQTKAYSMARTVPEKLDAWRKRAFWIEQALLAVLGVTDGRMHDTTLIELSMKLRESR